jgi:hypothetical protein
VGENGITKWAGQAKTSDVRSMAIVVLAVMVGVVLFDAHEFINARRR